MEKVTLSFNESLIIPMILLFIFLFLLSVSSTIIIMYIKISEKQKEILRVHNNTSEIRLMEFGNSIFSAIQSNSSNISNLNHLRNFNPRTFLDHISNQISNIDKNIKEIFEELKNQISLNGQRCLNSISQCMTQGEKTHMVQESRLRIVDSKSLIEEIGQSIISNTQQESRRILDLIQTTNQLESLTHEIVSSMNRNNQITYANILSSLQKLETHEGLKSLNNLDIGGKLQCIEDAIKCPYVEDPKQKEEVDRIVIETIKKLEERKRERDSLANLF